ncbi:hypothetical protein BGZ47_010763, partial [Haplosporangium gracile]
MSKTCYKPNSVKVRVDVFTFFNRVREIYTKHADDKTTAHVILFDYFKKFGDSLRMVFYVDGVPALEKKETYRKRDEKRAKTLKTAEVAIETLSDRVSQGKPPTKDMFKNVEGLCGAIKWPLQDRKDFVEFLHDIVLFHDSDFSSYDSIKTIWRPVGKIKILEYNREAVLVQTGLSTTKLTALAYVSCNDYNKNIPSLGIATNYNIVKDLPNAGKNNCLASMPHAASLPCGHGQTHRDCILIPFNIRRAIPGEEYLKCPRVEIAVPAGAFSDPSSTSQPAAPLTTSPAPSMAYDMLCQQYKLIKDRHANAKAQKHEKILSSEGTCFSDAKPDRQGKHKEFRRHRVIDRPTHQPGGSRQVHRPRYSFKAQPEPRQHRSPSICKQYQWKPSRDEETRTGALGAFIEAIFERGLTETDRTILYSLCPVVESKVRMAPQPNQDSQTSSSSCPGTPVEDKGEEVAEDDGDEDAESSTMDKSFIVFYQVLSAPIYSRKIKSKTVAGRQVGQLLARATSLGITLSPVPLCSVSYSINGLLESTNKQLYRSIKIMYRNGLVALEKKINSQADGQPGTVLPKIDPKLPAIENYLLLNKASGGSR